MLQGDMQKWAKNTRVSVGIQIRPPLSARDRAEPSGATLRCAPPALALRHHNLEVVNSSTPILVNGLPPFDR